MWMFKKRSNSVQFIKTSWLVKKNVTKEEIAVILKDTGHKDPKKRTDYIMTIADSFYSICHNKEVVGFSSFVSFESANQLLQIAVKESCQGMGIGRSLVIPTGGHLDKDLFLFVLDENFPAIEFYKKLGFQMCSQNLIEERVGDKILK